jgi:hypothetical protein
MRDNKARKEREREISKTETLPYCLEFLQEERLRDQR